MSLAQNPRRLVDGFASLEGGMDASRAPALISPEHCSFLGNMTVRGGHPHTRPPFREVQIKVGPLYGAGIEANARFNGGAVWADPSGESPSQLILCVGTSIYSVDPMTNIAHALASDQAIADAYFCQAERYLIIQNDLDVPYIYDGKTLQRATAFDEQYPIPVGSIMAYGQGRLFVLSKDHRSIVAGDIVFGGSEIRRQILSASVNSGYTEITTDKAHGLNVGDTVTIDQLTSSPDINGTYLVTAVPTDTTFQIAVGLSTQGSGGFATKAVPGQDSDLLRFSETTYIAEGFPFQLPFFMGRVRGMIFPPMEDNATGQGDLFVAGEYGAASFAVSAPRSQWKTMQNFQTVVFRDYGATSPLSFCAVNGDFFFRAENGIRNYRNSRLAFYQHGNQPLSGELNSLLQREDPAMLNRVSAVEFDNRLLMTASPNRTKEGWLYYDGIVPLDFNAVTVNFGKTTSAFDGIWTGPPILQLIAGNFGGRRRAYAVSFSRTTGPDQTPFIKLWELRREGHEDTNVDNGQFPINSHLLTRAYNFNSPLTLKKLNGARLWVSDVVGQVLVSVYFRADQNPVWAQWAQFSLTADTCLLTPADGNCPPVIQPKVPGYFPSLRLPTPTDACDPATGRPLAHGHEFEFRFDIFGYCKIVKLILHALDEVEAVGGDCPGAVLMPTVKACDIPLLDYHVT